MELIFPTMEYKQAAWEYRQEYIDGKEPTINGSGGLMRFDDYESWLDKVTGEQTVAQTGWVTCSTYFAFVGERIVGTIQVRHALNDEVRKHAGHIGYGVRSSERRKGYAAQMLRLALGKCKEFGIDKALLTCDKDNIASAKTIIKCGGVLEKEIVEDDGNILSRYLITNIEKYL